jgi:hypothetical protein
MAGSVASFYFFRLAWEDPFLSSTRPWVDRSHTPWYAWQPLFTPGASDAVIRTLIMSGALLSLGAARSRWLALAAYFVAVCLYRWNLPLLSVDDGLAHLLLFWLVLLPRGQKEPVAGFLPRLALANLSLIYLVAGLSKWCSPMWREGSALYAVLMLPGSRIPESWLVVWSSPLVLLTWSALLVEPALALLPWVKGRMQRWLAGLGILFHVSLVLSFDVPVANLACLAFYALALAPKPDAKPDSAPPAAAELVGLLATVWLTATMVGSALQSDWRGPGTGRDELGPPHQRALYAGLWVFGLAQQYRLLDWIDQRNYALRVTGGNGQHVRLPAKLRLGLALSYLTPVRWMATGVRPCPATRPWAEWLGQGQPGDLQLQVLRVHPSTAQHHPVVFARTLTRAP